MFMPKWLAWIIVSLMGLGILTIAVDTWGFIFLVYAAIAVLCFWAMFSLQEHYG